MVNRLPALRRVILSSVSCLIATSFSVSASIAQTPEELFTPLTKEQAQTNLDTFLSDGPLAPFPTPSISETWRGTKAEAQVGLNRPVILNFEGADEGGIFVEVNVSPDGTTGVKVSRSNIFRETTPYEINILTPKTYSIRSGDFGSFEFIVLGKQGPANNAALLFCPYIRKVSEENGAVSVGEFPSGLAIKAVDASLTAKAYGKFRSVLNVPGRLTIEILAAKNISPPREVKDSVVGKDPELEFAYIPTAITGPIAAEGDFFRTGLGMLIKRATSETHTSTTLTVEKISLSKVDFPLDKVNTLALKHVKTPLSCFLYEQTLERTEQFHD